MLMASLYIHYHTTNDLFVAMGGILDRDGLIRSHLYNSVYYKPSLKIYL